MNHLPAVSKGERAANLFEIRDGLGQIQRTIPAQREQIAAGHILEHEIVERRLFQIRSCTMPEPANYVRMANFIQGYGFVLKVLDQRAFKVRIWSSLQEGIKRLD